MPEVNNEDSGSDDIPEDTPKSAAELMQEEETARLIKQMNVLNRDKLPSSKPAGTLL